MKLFARLPLWILLPNLAFAAYGFSEVSRNWMPDLFIYRVGADLGWQGESPYSDKLVDRVKLQYPDDARLHANCGYFLPPMAIVVLGPFAAVPWATAKLLYLVASLGALAFCWYGTLTAFRSRSSPTLAEVPLVLPALILFHLVTIMTFDVGQTTILMAGAILAGQLAWQADRRWLSAFLWSLAFLKPHIALPLLPLALYLNGPRRMAMLLAWLAVLNLAGCLLAGGTPLFAFDYLQYLGDAHKQVEYNRVALNPQIVSWNAAMISVGGPAIDLTIVDTLLGMAIFTGLIILRCRIAQSIPSPSWIVAVAMTGGLVCSQVLGYEVFLLVLVIPYVLDCFDRQRKLDAYVVSLLLLSQILPLETMARFGLDYYRSWLVLLLALWLLIRFDATITDRRPFR